MRWGNRRSDAVCVAVSVTVGSNSFLSVSEGTEASMTWTRACFDAAGFPKCSVRLLRCCLGLLLCLAALRISTHLGMGMQSICKSGLAD